MSVLLSMMFGSEEHRALVKQFADMPVSFWIVDTIRNNSDSMFIVLSLGAGLFFTAPLDAFLCAMILNFKAPSLVLYSCQIIWYFLIYTNFSGYQSRK